MSLSGTCRRCGKNNKKLITSYMCKECLSRHCVSCDRVVKAVTQCQKCYYCTYNCGCHCLNCRKCRKQIPRYANKRLQTCADCVYCVKCMKITSDRCRRCLRCTKCLCTCIRCKVCYKLRTPGGNEHGCGSCMVACKRICKCKHRASALNHSLRLEVKDPVLNINNNSMTLPMQLPITFELEVADQKNLAQTIGTSLRYKAVSDGSISGSSPREYIFGPYQGDNLLVSLLRIAEILNQVKPEVNSSCGLHVHVDSSELDGIALSKLLAVWLIMEKGILKYICTPNRSNNSMCRMMTQHNQPFIDTVRQTLTETDSGNIRRIIKADIYKNSLDPKTYKEIKERKKTIKVAGDVLNAEAARKYNGARYHTLNLHSHFFRGTVEFRCMHSTINPMVIGSWPLMCGWIVNQAYSLDPKELLMDIEDIRFGDTAAKLIKYTEKLCPAFISDWVKSYII